MVSAFARSSAAIVTRTAPRFVIASTIVFVAMLATLPSCGGSSRNASLPPNIILIVANGLATKDLSCYYRKDAGVPRIHTANIDRLAHEGVRMTAFSAPLAGRDTQASLLTGRYNVPFKTLELDTTVIPMDIAMDSTETTLAELLDTRRYVTACVGRWRLGRRQPFLPTDRGFDFFYGIVRFDPQWHDVGVMRGTESAGTVPAENLDRRFADEAIAFIRRNEARPFFLFLGECAPQPLHRVEKVFEGRSKRGQYGDGVMSLDFQIGRVIQELRRRGIAGRTLVIVTSSAVSDGREHAPIRIPLGEKGLPLVEPDLNPAPCVVWWPGTVRPATIDSVTTTADLYPTIARIARADVSDTPLNGKDIGSLLWHR
jgi:arylsulfatase A